MRIFGGHRDDCTEGCGLLTEGVVILLHVSLKLQVGCTMGMEVMVRTPLACTSAIQSALKVDTAMLSSTSLVV